jgi:hypothetical protein
MKKNDPRQFSLDFGLDTTQNNDHSPDVAPVEAQILNLLPYIQEKEQERNARLYKNILDSVKHIC